MAVYFENLPGGVNTDVVAFNPVAKINAVITGITYTSRSGEYQVKNGFCKGWAKMVLLSKGSQNGAFTIDLPLAVKTGALGSVVIGARAKVAYLIALEAKIASASNSVVFFDYALAGTSSVAIDDADLSNDSSIEIYFDYPV